MGRKHSAKQEPKKNSVKQAAGRKGVAVRWNKTLDWHRELDQLRGGKAKGKTWKQRFHFVAIRYVLLWRTEARRSRWEDWPETARRELAELAQRHGVGLDHVMLGIPAEPGRWGEPGRRAIDGFPHLSLLEAGRKGRKPPWIHNHWKQNTLELICKVTAKERAAMAPSKAPKEASPAEIRRVRVAEARSFLVTENGRASVRMIQERLRVKYDTKVCPRTVWKDLQLLSDKSR